MQRTLEAVPRGDAHRSPASASKKRLAILVSALGACLTPSSQGNAAENPGTIAFQCSPPAGPSSAFFLSWQVPPGCDTAVLASLSPSPAVAPAEPTPSHRLDLTACLLIPLPVDREAGAAALDGVLPRTVTGESAHGTKITLRLVLFERATGECLVSDPIVLAAATAAGEAPAAAEASTLLSPDAAQAASEQPAEAPAGGGSSLPSQGAAGQSAKGAASSGGGGTYAATSGRSESNGTSFTKPGWGGILSGNAFLQLSPLLAITGAITATLSHDQPAPVQGSGH